MKLVRIANVCHAFDYKCHAMAVTSILERTEYEEVLSSALESVIADYSRDRFSLAGLILIGCGANLGKAHSLILDAATRDFPKISSFLQEHCVGFQTKTSEEKTLPQNLPEIHSSLLFSQIEAGTPKDCLSQEATRLISRFEPLPSLSERFCGVLRRFSIVEQSRMSADASLQFKTLIAMLVTDRDISYCIIFLTPFLWLVDKQRGVGTASGWGLTC
eukprot:m.198812 g.198812  ORF g.198812 m.198812 type:complete len:217 (+) comp39563_c1_seq13:2077-2727(+)